MRQFIMRKNACHFGRHGGGLLLMINTTTMTAAATTATMISKPTFKGLLKHIHDRQRRHCSFLSDRVSNTDNNNNNKILATEKWFQTIVIGQKLCPFAFPLLQNKDLLRIISSSATNTKEAIEDVKTEVQHLMDDNDAKHETTLIVFDNHKESFVKSYLDFIRLSWELQTDAIEETYQSKLQLVLFHPHATHQSYSTGYTEDPSSSFTGDPKDTVVQDNNEDEQDVILTNSNPSDYTIRSPYPIIHLLREEDVMKAVQSGYPNLEYLPSRNQAKLTDQGIQICHERLQECYNV